MRIIGTVMEFYQCASIRPELMEVLPEVAHGLAAQYFVGHGEDVKGFTIDVLRGLA